MNYRRRRGEVVQVVNLQVGHGSTAVEKLFYINVGLAFDALSRLAGLPIWSGRRNTSAMTGGRGTAWNLWSPACRTGGASVRGGRR